MSLLQEDRIMRFYQNYKHMLKRRSHFWIFLDLFKQSIQKGLLQQWWVSTSKDRTKLVFSFKNMKYTYKLKDDFYKDNVAFIVKQLYENIGDIKTKEDIENLSFFII